MSQSHVSYYTNILLLQCIYTYKPQIVILKKIIATQHFFLIDNFYIMYSYFITSLKYKEQSQDKRLEDLKPVKVLH
jgi:hypothetical protein